MVNQLNYSMGHVTAINTSYNGYNFRSRLEARWAIFFDQMGVDYVYESEGFNLDGIRYLPDFYLPKGIQIYGENKSRRNIWLEVKPPIKLSDADNEKINAFLSHTDNQLILVSGDPGPESPVRLVAEQPAGQRTALTVQWIDLDGEAALLDNTILENASEIDRARLKALSVTPRLIAAYATARKARFEHGEKPLPPPEVPKAGTVTCNSCGRTFRPKKDYYYLCYGCYNKQAASRSNTRTAVAASAPPKPTQLQQQRPKWQFISLAIVALLAIIGGLFFLFTGTNARTSAGEPAVLMPIVAPATATPAIQNTATPLTTVAPSPTPVCNCTGNNYDCSDFKSQTAAQACHDYCYADAGDVHFLDSNDDHRACESLP